MKKPVSTARRGHMIEAAKRYAAANKSDPFALPRAMLHINNGICDVDQHGRNSFYDALESEKERMLPDGTTYMVKVYRNVERV